MIRDLDLARQLLLDIESRGADCSVSVLRSEAQQDPEDRIRYHLRLLLDAGLLKEVDRTSSGVLCVRLTNDGHELLALARSDAHWQEAQWVCRERLGGLSLTAIRSILTRWAIGGVQRYGRRPAPARVRYRNEPQYYREAPSSYGLETQRYAERPAERYDDRFTDWGAWDEDSRYVRVRPQRTEHRDNQVRPAIDVDGDGRVDFELDSPLPSYVL